MKMLLAVSVLLLLAPAARAEDPAVALGRSVFKELIEINTTDSIGSTTKAAEAMKKRLLDAGFPPADVQVLGPRPRKGNLVARLRGSGKKKPVLWICHLDVVEARREDWTMDPFKFTEKDGYFYGRGTEDVKDGDALLVTTFIRFKKEGYVPDRDIILALTADEEGGTANGVDWLLKNHRDLIDAEFVLNPDAGMFQLKDGKRNLIGLQASEKLYADFQFEATSPGGHSARPKPGNPIYVVSDGLLKLSKLQFPFELNEVTRGYFSKQIALTSGQEQADIKGILATPPDEGSVLRLSSSPFQNARFRTTCVATRMEAGHANNALPGFARAIVNCRILPGHTAEEIRDRLVHVVSDPRVSITQVDVSSGMRTANPPSPLRPEIVGALESVAGKLWPGVPVVPFMDAGASDGAITRAAGLPTYGVAGVFIDINDDRSHGRDERLSVAAFDEAVDFFYRFNKTLTSAP